VEGKLSKYIGNTVIALISTAGIIILLSDVPTYYANWLYMKNSVVVINQNRNVVPKTYEVQQDVPKTEPELRHRRRKSTIPYMRRYR